MYQILVTENGHIAGTEYTCVQEVQDCTGTDRN